MTIQFRTRIPSSIDYDDLLNRGICCRDGITLENKNYFNCCDEAGQFFPGNPDDPNLRCPPSPKGFL